MYLLIISRYLNTVRHPTWMKNNGHPHLSALPHSCVDETVTRRKKTAAFNSFLYQTFIVRLPVRNFSARNKSVTWPPKSALRHFIVNYLIIMLWQNEFCTENLSGGRYFIARVKYVPPLEELHDILILIIFMLLFDCSIDISNCLSTYWRRNMKKLDVRRRRAHCVDSPTVVRVDPNSLRNSRWQWTTFFCGSFK